MSIKKLFIFLLVAFSFSACSVKNFKYIQEDNDDTNKTITKISDKEYKNEKLFEWKISAGDRIEIQAYNQSSTSSNGQLRQLLNSGGQKYYTQRYGDEGMLVTTEGKVNLPLIGTVKVLGLTEKEAAEHILKKYQVYLKHPFVYVKILNQKLFVIGEVNKPGVVLVTNGTMNLFEALATSGDLTDFANRTNIKILRGDMRNPEVREVNLNDFHSIKFASLILRPNDVVYVEPRDSKSSVVGVNEELPIWDLVSKVLAPFTSAAIIYGVTR